LVVRPHPQQVASFIIQAPKQRYAVYNGGSLHLPTSPEYQARHSVTNRIFQKRKTGQAANTYPIYVIVQK